MANSNAPKVVNDLQLAPFATPDGGFFADAGNIFSDGAGNFQCGTWSVAQSTAAAVAIATGNTVALLPNSGVVRLAPAAAVTGIIMPLGPATRNMFLVIVVTTAAANTVTFAAMGTSFVAGGAAVSLAGLAAHLLYWDSVAQLWYQCGPLAN